MEEKTLNGSQVHTNWFCLIFLFLSILICYFGFCLISNQPEYRKKIPTLSRKLNKMESKALPLSFCGLGVAQAGSIKKPSSLRG